VPELKQLYWIVEVLQSVPAEVDKMNVLRDEVSCPGGEDYLTAVRRGGDSRCQVHVKTNVVVIADERLARV